MTLPVSSYEELLARVRSLTSETIQLRHEITSSLCDRPELRGQPINITCDNGNHIRNYATHPQRRSTLNEEAVRNVNSEFESRMSGDKPTRPTSLFAKKEDEVDIELKEVDEKRTLPDIISPKDAFHRNDWGPESLGLWHSGPSSLSLGQNSSNGMHQDLSGVTSFNASLGSGIQSLNTFSTSSRRTYSHQQLGAKVEMVYNLLSLLGTNNREDMSKTFLAMSSSPESCHAMRQSGCLPLLIQLIHSPELDIEVRNRAAEALHNVVHAQTDDKRRRREIRVLKLLQQVREYCDELKFTASQKEPVPSNSEKHPVTAIGALMKFSFDAEHRQAICTLGGLQAITELIQLDHEAHGSTNDDTLCITLRRYAGMSLTNLTFGDGKNKALLCSFNKFMHALVDQLKSPSEDLRQVTASVLRNLSWRADSESKQALRDVGAVTALTVTAMEGKKESTLKSILSALWNLSAHCSMNKVDICSVPGALAFLVKMLRYKSTTNTLAIVENAGGIIRNISSHIAVREDYRQILRDNNCFEILLEQLKSPSLTIVSNACGTLWNLSARCSEDQKRLWEMGATSMLRSLVQSKHKMISMGSSAALKNLLTANPNGSLLTHLDSTARNLGLQSLPTLFVRKQRALEQELDITLAETCDNIEPSGSPTHLDKPQTKVEDKKPTSPKRSDSHESIRSTQSDSVYERINQIAGKNENKLLENKNVTLHDSLNERQARKDEDQKLMRRYKVSMIPTPAFKKMNQEKINEKTREETLTEETASSSISETDAKTKTNTETKEKAEIKRGIPVLKNRTKLKINHGQGPSYNHCFSGSNFSPQYEEECPINYSLKYSETESYKANNKNENPERKFNENKKFQEYPDYAETDLDQPTDFSLKYGEKTSSDEDIKNQGFNYYENDKTKGSGYYSGQAESEDTTRTYYTEGTPYDGTPYNFSSSNSMTDLRMDPADDRESSKTFSNKKGGDVKLIEQENRNNSLSDERKECNPHYENIEKNCQTRLKRLSREFESGVSTPERPVQYCEEGTPGDCFSRVSSLSSLSSGKESSNKNSPEKNTRKCDNKNMKKIVKNEEEDTSQNKVVKFGVTEHYACEDQTPLMFSRCSSMNSLSSFEHITQLIPDDRSSVVSDFSRMTSGVISPSELPDSPTQTVPPSPKRNKAPMPFPPVKAEFPQKKSVFEDDVASYKQEDTPIEFSRATSLSSLNIDNSVKSDLILKTNSTASSVSTDEIKPKDESHNNSSDKNCSDNMKEQIVSEKVELDREKFELTSVTEVDESILADCINIGIQENSRKPLTNCSRRMHKNVNNYVNSTGADGGRHGRQSGGFAIKPSNRSKFPTESGKMYSTYEASDDAVHTYHTEGTPANISHAGSHSDLSTLSMVSGIPPSGIEDNSDDGSFCSGDTESILAECIQSGMPKAKPHKDKIRVPPLDDPVEMAMNKRLSTEPKNLNAMSSREIYLSSQARFEYLRKKDHQLTAKDEISTFATENSPCNFSVRSSLSDLTINSTDSPACPTRPEASGEPSSHALSPVHNVSQPSPNSINLIEDVDAGKASEERERCFISSKSISDKSKYWDEKSELSDTRNPSYDSSSNGRQNYSDEMVTVRTRTDSPSSISVESFDSSEPTPLEQALLEQCIHSGMPHKSTSKKLEGNNFKPLNSYDESSKLISVTTTLNRLRISSDADKENDFSKNVKISSAAVEGGTAADERLQKRVVEGLENIKMSADQIPSTFTRSNEVDLSQKTNEVVAAAQRKSLINDLNGEYQTKECSALIHSVNDEIEKLRNTNSDDYKKINEVVPNFKIGSEITDSKFLQYEANKICQEIRKYQEMDMGCSLTSEVSLVSCSSFLDANDYSLFEFSNETVDFDESENQNKNKASSKVKNFPFRKPPVSLTGEPVSLPSLGSLKNEQIEAMDLESSIISVASITSEIADTYPKDKDYCNTYTKTYKNETSEAHGESMEDVDKEDETLNNNVDLLEDDSSLRSQENLPLDPENAREFTPKLSRKLTPKEKRKTIEDRYRTYTIRDLKASMSAEAAAVLAAQERKRITPKQRRMNDKNRFLTQTLGKDDTLILKTEDTTADPYVNDYENSQTNYQENFNHKDNLEGDNEEEADEETLQPMDLPSTISVPERKHQMIKASKSLDKGGHFTHNLLSDSKSLNDLLSIGPAERKELVHNAKLVAFSLKTAVHDFDSEASAISDSEAEGCHTTFEIDTETYNKGYKDCNNFRISDGDYRDYQEQDDKQDSNSGYDTDEDLKNKGPRILKPSEKNVEDKTEETAKAIRGRRKQLYSSPLKNTRRSISSTPSSPKISQTQTDTKKYVLMTTKSLPNVPKSIPKSSAPSPLQREGTFTKEEGSVLKKSGVKTVRGIPVLARNADAKAPTPAVRNKSAPVLRNSKYISETPRAARPVSTGGSKVVGPGTRTTSAMTGKNQSTTNVTLHGIRNSSSNQSLKSNSSAKSASSIKSKNSVLQSPKSQSNGSLDSSSSSDKGKPKTPKKEVSSKIAKLWKKVEETKQKNRNVKDSRVWIEAEKDTKVQDEILVLEQEEILDIPTGKIVKSSTFQGISDAVAANQANGKPEIRNKVSRNSEVFSHVKSPQERKGTTEGRSVISAIVPPFNYHPPTASIGSSSTNLKKVDNFHKGSMKITTV